MLALVLVPLRAFAVDATIWAELARVSKLQAHFEQVQHRAILKQPLSSTGEVSFDRTGPKLAWNVTAPSKSSFTLDGKVAKMAYPDLGMSETIDLAQVPDASRLATSLLVWMQADASAVDRDFVATYSASAAALKPRDKQLAALISEIDIAFAPGPWRVRSVKLVEPDGDNVDIAFRSVVLDGKAVADPQ